MSCKHRIYGNVALSVIFNLTFFVILKIELFMARLRIHFMLIILSILIVR
jgi:hypothetical protein